jgi:uncharacterized phage protein (TIGR01671 family)
MREIKFRAWFGDKMIKPMSLQKMIHQKDNTIPLKVLEKEIIFMQYAGLKDKNGVEIYEWDIVIVENYNHHGKNPKKVMFVYYDNLSAQYCIKIEKTNFKIEDLIMENQPLCFAHSIEIIGNIYENKELLNK